MKIALSNLLLIILIFLGQKLYRRKYRENTGELVIEKSEITCIVFGSAVGLGLSGNSSPPAKNSFIPFTLNHHAIRNDGHLSVNRKCPIFHL